MVNCKLDNKRVALVATGNEALDCANKLLKLLEKEIKEARIFPCVYQDYADYYQISEYNPDILIFMQDGKPDRIVPVSIRDVHDNQLVDTSESRELAQMMKHDFMMIRNPVNLLGSYIIDYGVVKEIRWYINNKKPMILVKTNYSTSENDAIANAIKDGIVRYFKKQ